MNSHIHEFSAVLLFAVASLFSLGASVSVVFAQNANTANFLPVAQEMIERGDAASARANELRAEAAELEGLLADSGEVIPNEPKKQQARALDPASFATISHDERKEIEKRLARINVDTRLFENKSIDYWQRAMALDANAQEEILKRLRGIEPRS